MVVFQAAVIILTLAFALYAYYYFDHLHYNVTRGYAHLGYSSAQHQVGQRFLHGTYPLLMHIMLNLHPKLFQALL